MTASASALFGLLSFVMLALCVAVIAMALVMIFVKERFYVLGQIIITGFVLSMSLVAVTMIVLVLFGK